MKVEFRVQFPFSCCVPKVTLLSLFKGSAWGETWGHSHLTGPSAEVPCGDDGSGQCFAAEGAFCEEVFQ